MIYELSPEVFTSSNHVAIMSLLDRSVRGRLYLSVRDRAPQYEQWLSELRPHERDLWMTMLDWAELDSTVHRIQIVRVAAATSSSWELSSPILTIGDASQLADNSVDILLENGRNDRAFLLAMAGPQRSYMETLERVGALRFSGEGGIGEMKARIRDQLVGRDDRALRLFALFDSDADAPNEPSEHAQAVAEICRDARIAFHCLSRRAIENYIPVGGLFDYAELARGPVKRARRDLSALIKELSIEQRSHFPMKTGLPADLKPVQERLFGGLEQRRANILRTGFGDQLSSVFTNVERSRIMTQIEQDVGKEEVRAVIERVLFLARAPNA